MANDIQQEIRNEAKRLLEAGEVKVVIGYEQGSAPFMSTPAFVESAEDVDRLIWTPACSNNLAVYLPQEVKNGKVAIVAKGCDARSVVMMVQEHQLDRSSVYIIGVPCEGVVDSEALAGAVRLDDIRGLDWENGAIEAQMAGTQKSLNRDAVVKVSCRNCAYPVPVGADMIAGGEVQIAATAAESPNLGESFEERRRFWAEQFDKCTRCYACRQACPGCFCKECFIDRIVPRWAAKRNGASDAWMFHITRAMHQAGRCSQCGECSRVCPMGIPVHELTREVERHVAELFDYTAGLDWETDPALGAFKAEDPDPSGHGG